MSGGAQRPGVGGWSWFVLVLSVVVGAAAAGVAKLAGAPAGLVILAAIVGVIVPAGSAAVRAQLEQSRKVAADQRRLTAGAAGRDRSVQDYSAAEAGVHRAIRQDVPYIERDVEPEIVGRIRLERRVLIVGPSMAGKTRLALSAAKRAVGDFGLYVPADGKSIHEELAAGTRFSNVLVWLDDLERYLGAGGLSDADLTTLYASKSVAVVATIRSSEYDELQPRGDIKPAGWEVPGWFGDPVWVTSWSSRELDRVGETPAGASVLDDARKYGLSNYLGGAPLIRREMKLGTTEHPEGFAVVRAAADWRRVGMEEPISRVDLVEVLPAYLPQKYSSSIDDQTTKGLEWALRPLNHTVALMTEEADGFVALDLVLDLSTEKATAIPEPLWSSAIHRASPGALVGVGYRAYLAGKPSITSAAWQRAAAAGNPNAMYNLGVLLERGNPPDLAGARQWYEQAAAAGDTDAMHNLGTFLQNADPPDLGGARQWYEQAVAAGHTGAMNNLGVLLEHGNPPDLDGARGWWQKAAAAGNTDAMFNLGLLLQDADPSDLDGARGWWQKAAAAGNTDAMFNLGVLLQSGNPPDLDGARGWWQKAAAAGNTDAMFNLGVLLQSGNPPDLDGARGWWQKAAAAGNTDAMFNLGVLLQSGNPPDLDGVRHWYKRAADAGHTRASGALRALEDGEASPG